jgi:anthranilate synthase component 2
LEYARQQAIGEVYGGTLSNLIKYTTVWSYNSKKTTVTDEVLFQGLENEFGGRYHSVVDATLPDVLEATLWRKMVK